MLKPCPATAKRISTWGTALSSRSSLQSLISRVVLGERGFWQGPMLIRWSAQWSALIHWLVGIRVMWCTQCHKQQSRLGLVFDQPFMVILGMACNRLVVSYCWVCRLFETLSMSLVQASGTVCHAGRCIPDQTERPNDWLWGLPRKALVFGTVPLQRRGTKQGCSWQYCPRVLNSGISPEHVGR